MVPVTGNIGQIPPGGYLGDKALAKQDVKNHKKALISLCETCVFTSNKLQMSCNLESPKIVKKNQEIARQKEYSEKLKLEVDALEIDVQQLRQIFEDSTRDCNGDLAPEALKLKQDIEQYEQKIMEFLKEIDGADNRRTNLLLELIPLKWEAHKASELFKESSELHFALLTPTEKSPAFFSGTEKRLNRISINLITALSKQ